MIIRTVSPEFTSRDQAELDRLGDAQRKSAAAKEGGCGKFCGHLGSPLYCGINSSCNECDAKPLLPGSHSHENMMAELNRYLRKELAPFCLSDGDVLRLGTKDAWRVARAALHGIQYRNGKRDRPLETLDQVLEELFA